MTRGYSWLFSRVCWLTLLFLLLSSSLLIGFPLESRSSASALLLNSGFEVVTSGLPESWTASYGVATSVSFPIHGGTKAAALTTTTLGQSSLSQAVPVSGGVAYRLSGYAIKNDPHLNEVALSIAWYAGPAGTGSELLVVRSPGALFTDSPAYRSITTGTVVAPAGAVSARVSLVINLVTLPIGIVYCDDFEFEMVAEAPPSTPTATNTATLTPTNTATAEPPAPRFTATATPKKSTSTATPSVMPTPAGTGAGPADVVINEVQYQATSVAPGADDGDYEWIELYNRTAGTVTLRGWTLSDNLGRDTLPELILPSGQFVVIAATERFNDMYPHIGRILYLADHHVGNGLSNSGDRLVLKDGVGQIIDAISYGTDTNVFNPACPPVKKGHSLSRQPAGYDTNQAMDFVENDSPSPGTGAVDRGGDTVPDSVSKGQLVSPLAIVADRVQTIAAAKLLAKSSKAILLAQITAGPDIIRSRSMYVEDATGGIMVYLEHGKYPPLERDNWVLLTGSIDERNGEKQIRVYANYDSVFVKPGEPVMAIPTSIGQIGNEVEGALVQINGKLDRKFKTQLTVDDGSGLLLIDISRLSPTEIPDLSVGDDLVAVGLVSQYDSSPPYDEGYRLIPRDGRDITKPPRVPAVPDPSNRSPSERQVRPSALPRTGDGGSSPIREIHEKVLSIRARFVLTMMLNNPDTGVS